MDNCSNMFRDLNNITYINLLKFNSSRIIDMSNMFNGCKSLISLDLRNFNTKSCQNMEKYVRIL